jgi:hypothetical protein
MENNRGIGEEAEGHDPKEVARCGAGTACPD